MTYVLDTQGVRNALAGILVDRDTATLPQSGREDIFTIAGGRVLITSIVGEVTTVLGAGTTPEIKVVFNPDATGASTDLCANLNVASDAVGTLYSVSGDYSAPMTQGLLTLESPAVVQAPFMLSEGVIELECDESITGSIAWSITYIPYDDGATVTAA